MSTTTTTPLTRRARKAAVLLVLAMAAVVLPGCGERTDDSDRLRQAIERTRRLGARVDYMDERPGGPKVTVQGLIEDDFRFKARVLYDDVPGWDEVVADDVLAMRMIDPMHLSSLVDKSLVSVDSRTEIEGVDVLQALRSRRWVVDPSNAPAVSSLGMSDDKIGLDPALDALTALDYVQNAATQAFGVKRWSEDDLNPTYARTEDPFERPSKDSGLTRYDLVRQFLPAPADARGAGGQTALPATKHFRKMAVYVRDGLVVKVDERVEVTGKGLREFVKYYRLLLREFKVADQIRNNFESLVANTPEERLGAVLLGDLSKNLQSFGQPPILQRNMRLELNDIGSEVKITLPQEQVIRGNLSVMVTSAASKKPKSTGTQGGGDSGTTTTTAPSTTDTTGTTDTSAPAPEA